jgi:hypothetical protein
MDVKNANSGMGECTDTKFWISSPQGDVISRRPLTALSLAPDTTIRREWLLVAERPVRVQPNVQLLGVWLVEISAPYSVSTPSSVMVYRALREATLM